MRTKYLEKEFLIPTIYLLIFTVCLFFAYPFRPEATEWFISLFVLTLPWSIIAGFFIMGALHLGDDKGIVFIFSLLAVLNTFLFYWVTKFCRKFWNKQ